MEQIEGLNRRVEIHPAKLTALLDAAELSRAEVARRLGVTRGHVANIAAGRGPQPSYRLAVRLANILAVDVCTFARVLERQDVEVPAGSHAIEG